MEGTSPRTTSPRSGSMHLPPRLTRLLSLTTWIGLAGFAVAEVVQLIQHGTGGFGQATFVNALVWVVGVNALVAGGGHLFFPDPVADAIGWPKGSPFQWEVGLADTVIGVLGVISPGFDRDFQWATVLAFSIFFLGAAVGHVRERIVHGNKAPGNAGFIFWFDIIGPLAVVALYFATA